MKFWILLLSFLVLNACTQKPDPGAILKPIQDAGCAVESAITGGFGSEVVSACAGTDAIACGQAFQSALGNVNLCQTPLPQQPPQVAASPAPVWKKIGDVPADALKSDKLKAVPMGIVGAIACPIAVNTVLGLLTAQIPPACGCKQSLSASQMGSALLSACVAAVPL